MPSKTTFRTTCSAQYQPPVVSAPSPPALDLLVLMAQLDAVPVHGGDIGDKEEEKLKDKMFRVLEFFKTREVGRE